MKTHVFAAIAGGTVGAVLTNHGLTQDEVDWVRLTAARTAWIEADEAKHISQTFILPNSNLYGQNIFGENRVVGSTIEAKERLHAAGSILFRGNIQMMQESTEDGNGFAIMTSPAGQTFIVVDAIIREQELTNEEWMEASGLNDAVKELLDDPEFNRLLEEFKKDQKKKK